jgi:hypothetical protein
MVKHFGAIKADTEHLPSGFHKVFYQTTVPEGWKLVQDVSTKDRPVLICRKL